MNEFIVPKPINEIPVVPIADIQTGNILAYTGTGDLKQISANALLAQITSGIFGKATQSNSPDPDPAYKRYNVVEPITTGSAWGIEVTQLELDANRVFFDVENGVVSKFVEPILKGDSAYQSYLDTTTDSPPMTEADWSVSFANSVIGTFPNTIESDESLTDLTGATWVDGFYMNSVGVLVANANTRYLKIDVKAGDTIAYKLQIINEVPTNIFVPNVGSVVAGYAEQSNNEYNFAELFTKDGSYYINQNSTNNNVSFIHFYNSITETINFAEYVDNKFLVNANGNLESIPLEVGRKGAFYNLNTATIGTSTINSPFFVQADHDMSRYFKVVAGEKIFVTGQFGWNGVALFNESGILTHKLLYFPMLSTYVTDYEIVIPADGFMTIGFDRTKINSLKKISSVKEEISIQELYNGVGNQQINITTKEFLSIHKPNNAIVVNLTGTAPTAVDVVSEMVVDFYDGDVNIFKCNSEIEWQGQSSLTYPKKNFSIDLKNANGDDLVLKIGDLVGSDAFHLKGFQIDVSMVRDHTASKLWYDIRKSAPYPSCLMANLPNDTSSTASDKNYFEEDAKFFADGFPIELHINGNFQGLYIWRLKKAKENYKLDSAKKTNIFLEYDYTLYMPGGVFTLFKWNEFDYKQFELKSPKITGYVPGGEIADATVMTSINNFWSWTTAIYNNTSTAGLEQYVDLVAWYDYMIALEVSNHWDGFNNNILIMSHDGIKFSPYIYDTDHTFGIWNDTTLHNAKSNFILNSGARGSAENIQFWVNFRTKYNTQIKARYTELRNFKIISIQNINKIAVDFIKPYSYNHFKKESIKWGYGVYPAIGKAHLRQILECANNSIAFLDTQWLI